MRKILLIGAILASSVTVAIADESLAVDLLTDMPGIVAVDAGEVTVEEALSLEGHDVPAFELMVSDYAEPFALVAAHEPERLHNVTGGDHAAYAVATNDNRTDLPFEVGWRF